MNNYLDSRSQFNALKYIGERFPSNWIVKQNNYLDSKTNFIYKIQNHIDLLNFIAENNLTNEEANYAIHRWKNFIRHDAWLLLISKTLPNFSLPQNLRDREKDFSIEIGGQQIDFDLKVTRQPKSVSKNLTKLELAYWMYENQSTQSRFHLKNRFFVIGDPEDSLYDYDLGLATLSETASNIDHSLIDLSLTGGESCHSIVLRLTK